MASGCASCPRPTPVGAPPLPIPMLVGAATGPDPRCRPQGSRGVPGRPSRHLRHTRVSHSREAGPRGERGFVVAYMRAHIFRKKHPGIPSPLPLRHNGTFKTGRGVVPSPALLPVTDNSALSRRRLRCLKRPHGARCVGLCVGRVVDAETRRSAQAEHSGLLGQ